MRIFLRSRGNPDSRKEVIISPKMVKDCAKDWGFPLVGLLFFLSYVELGLGRYLDWEGTWTGKVRVKRASNSL